MRPTPILAALLVATAATAPVRAADSFDACSGYIDRVPAVISAPGVWCLRKHLSATLATGAAIAVEADDVTIDCNGYKLGGLNAGAGTAATGIRLGAQADRTTVRNCHVRGFRLGIGHDDLAQAGDGTIVEDNRLDGVYGAAIQLGGDGAAIRRNRITDTGGSTVAGTAGRGILSGNGSGAVIIDNEVQAVSAATVDVAYGIALVLASDFTVAGNHVSNLDSSESYGIAIAMGTAHGSVRGNQLFGAAAADIGIACGAGNAFVARDNVVVNFATPIAAGCTLSNNSIAP